MIAPLPPIVLSAAEMEATVGGDIDEIDTDERLPRRGRRRRSQRIPH